MIRKLLAGYSLFVLVCATIPASAQEGFHDPLLDHITGNWVLQGRIAGKETTHDIAAEWVLNHEYIQFHETAREKDATGRPAYDAIVFLGWDKKANQIACLWLDTTSGDGLASGVLGRGTRNGNEITFLFKGGDGSTFHTVFAYDPPADTWQWRMDGEDQGKLQPFARVTLKKK